MRQLDTCFFSLIKCAFSIDAPNHPTLLGGALRTEIKIREIILGNYRFIKFGPRCLSAQGALLRQYFGARIPIFHSSVDFFISLSPFSQLSPSPHF